MEIMFFVVKYDFSFFDPKFGIYSLYEILRNKIVVSWSSIELFIDSKGVNNVNWFGCLLTCSFF